jgi:hypothetical protein
MEKKYSFLIPVVLCSLFLFTFSSRSVFAVDDGNTSYKPFHKGETLLKQGGIFNLSLDVQLGLTISNTKFNFNATDTNSSKVTGTSAKPGPSIGAFVSIYFLGFGFSSGLVYSAKGFQTSSGENFNYHYLNIPLLFYFNFDFGKVIIDGNIGPYFGLLLNQDEITSNPTNNPYLLKNFDLGVTGNLQGTYMFAKHLGVLLGGRFEYGGLNNLISNELISSVSTQTFFIYTGMRFVL